MFAFLANPDRFMAFSRWAAPLLGAVENMPGLVCPHCGETIEVFPPVPAGRSLWDDGIRRLVSIPLDPALAELNGLPPAFVELADAVELSLA